MCANNTTAGSNGSSPREFSLDATKLNNSFEVTLGDWRPYRTTCPD